MTSAFTEKELMPTPPRFKREVQYSQYFWNGKTRYKRAFEEKKTLKRI